MDTAAPISLSNFRFIRVIGEGGMGRVWLAEQLNPRREVAIKVIEPDPNLPPALFETLRQEGHTAARFDHPNLVQVIECGIVEGHYYLVMQHLAGGSLEDRLRGGPVDPEGLRSVLHGIAGALSAIHDSGFVHRDIKPGNILFTADGRPVLADFGIAKQSDSAGLLTSAGFSIGTPAYMSPEQIRNEALDSRSDLYSLGVVAYEALTGHLPFNGRSAHELKEAHLHQPVPALDRSMVLQPIVDGLLAKTPDDRFVDARALQRALDGEPVSATFAAPHATTPLPSTPDPQRVSVTRWFRELRQRRVIQTAGLYAAAAWSVTEIGQALIDAFGWPERWGQWLLLAFIAGFPLAIGLSWAFEARAGRLRADRRPAPPSLFWLTAGGSLAVSILLLIGLLRQVPAPGPAIRPFDLVVVPGTAAGGEEASLLLAGLVRDLERELSARSDLRLFSSRAAVELIGRHGESAGVPAMRLVEISIQQSDRQIRLQAQLSVVESGILEWNEVLDDTLADFFALQDRLSGQLAEALQAQLTRSAPLDRPDDLDAYLALQQARRLLAGGGRSSVISALDRAKEALRLDPDYADARALIGNLYLDLIQTYPTEERWGLMRFSEYAETIAGPDGHSGPEGLRLQFRLESGSYLIRDARGWQPEDAIRPWPFSDALQQALTRWPDATGLSVLAAFTTMAEAAGQVDDWRAAHGRARELIAQALARDPVNLDLLLALAAFSGDEIDRLQRLQEDHPDHYLPRQRLAWAHHDRGQIEPAARLWLEAYRSDPDTLSARINLLRGLLDLQALDLARSLTEQVFDETVIDPEFATLAAAVALSEDAPDNIQLILGLAEEWLRQASEQHAMPCLMGIAEVWSGGEPDTLDRLTPEQADACDQRIMARFGDSLALRRAMSEHHKGAVGTADAWLERARQAVNRKLLLRDDGADWHLSAAILAWSDDLEGALEALDRAESAGWRRAWFSRRHPAFSALHDDERFQLFLDALDARVDRDRRQFLRSTEVQGNLSSASLASSNTQQDG